MFSITQKPPDLFFIINILFYKLLMFKINLIMYWLGVSSNGGLLYTLWYALATKPIA